MIAEQTILQTQAAFAGMTDILDLPDTEATGFRRLLRTVARHAQTLAIALLDGLALASNPGFEFEAEGPGITVTVAHRRVREFLIEADCDHAFITLQGRELLLDEFSRLALEDTFFTPPQLRYLMEGQEW